MIGGTRKQLEAVVSAMNGNNARLDVRLSALERDSEDHFAASQEFHSRLDSYGENMVEIEARLSALEDSLEAAEAQIAERKAENVYLNRLLDMLQHGVKAKGGEVAGDGGVSG